MINRKFPVDSIDGSVRFMDYYEYINSVEWRRKAYAFKKQAGFRCQSCGMSGKIHLTIHHPTYSILGKEEYHQIKVLCWDCHEPLKELHL